MKLEYILLKNVVGIYVGMQKKKMEVNFDTDNMFNLILGDNGSGKSTFLDCINPLSSPSILEGKKGYIEQHYRKGRERFIIRQFYEPKSSGGHSVKKYLMTIDAYGNESELNENGNVTSYKELVELHLGLNQANAQLIRLGMETNNLIKMSPTERKKYISLFTNDTKIYEHLYKKVNGDAILINKLVKSYADKLNELGKIDKVIEKLDKTNEELDVVLDKEIAVQAKRTQLQKEIEDNKLSDKEKDRLTEIKEIYNKVTKTKEKIISQYGDIMEKDSVVISNTLDTVINNIETKESYLNVLKNHIDSSDNEIKRLKDKYYDIELDIEKISMDVDEDLLDEFNKYNKIIKENKSIYDKWNDVFKNISIDSFISIINYYSDTEESVESIKQQMNIDDINNYKYDYDYSKDYMKILNDISIVNSSIMTIEKEISDVKSILNGFQCDNIKCPLLKKFFANGTNVDELLLLKENHEKKLNKLESVKESLYNLNQLNNLYKSIVSYLNQLNENIFKLIDAKSIIKDIKSGNFTSFDSNRVHNLIELHNMYTTYVDANNKLIELESIKIQIDNKNRLNKELESVVKDIENAEKIRKDYIKLIEDTNNEIEKLYDNKESLEYVYKNKKNFDEINSLIIEYNELYDRIKLCSDNNNALLILNEELENVIELKQSLTKDRDKLNYTLKQIKEISHRKQVYEENSKDIDILRKTLSTTNGIPLFFVKSFLKTTRNIANKIMRKAFDGELELGKFKIDEGGKNEFRIPLIKGGNENKDISKASSGERSIAALAISFALIRQSKCGFNILYFDELDGPLDKKKRAKFLNLIDGQVNKLGIEQIFMISHNGLFDDYPVNLLLFKGAKTTSSECKNKDVIFDY